MDELGGLSGIAHDPLRLEHQICYRLYVASIITARRYRPRLEALGLTYLQYLIMLILWEGEPRTVGQLGERLHLDSSTMTPALKRMEVIGLLVRQRDTMDERRVFIELTHTGQELRQRAVKMLKLMKREARISPTALDLLGNQLDQYIMENSNS